MPARPRVLVDPHPRPMNAIFSDGDLERLREVVDVRWGLDEPIPVDAAREEMGNAAAIVFGSWRYGDLPPSTTLQAVIDVSGGFPTSFDYDTARTEQIRVLTAGPAFAPSVAEMGLGLALAGAREIVVGDRSMRGRSESWFTDDNEGMFSLFDASIGLVGFGSIGQELRRILAPFRPSISVFDPYMSPGHLKALGVVPKSLEEVVSTSRVLFVVAAPTQENFQLLDRRVLSLIPSNGLLVLLSRAHLVDFGALTEHLRDGRYRAAIDVYPNEPLDARDPIRDAHGVVLSAHRAGCNPEALRLIGEMVVDDIEALVAGYPPARLRSADLRIHPRPWRNLSAEEHRPRRDQDR